MSQNHLTDGDIVYVDYLHLNSARLRKPSKKAQHFWYEVEGKARPALRFGERLQNGVMWHRVFRITTKGLNEKGKIKKRHIPLSNLIDSERESYICSDSEWYPDNLLSKDECGQNRVIKRLEPLDKGRIMKIICFNGLGGGDVTD